MDNTAGLNGLLTTDQVAHQLGIGAQTLQNWRSTGRHTSELPHVKIGGAVRYRSEDVERVRQEGIVRREDSDAA